MKKNQNPIFFILICLGGVSGTTESFSESLSVSIGGEVYPNLTKIDSILNRYKQRGIKYITFHHQGYSDGLKSKFNRLQPVQDGLEITKRMENINTGHRVKWGMYAYHYAIDHRGDIGKGRPVKFAPATGTNFDFRGHFAVVALGDYKFETLNKKSRYALVKVMSAAQRKFKVHSKNILPHIDHASTSCPGTYILNERARLVAMTLNFSIQTELKIRGCNPGSIDGYAGQKTTSAFNRFVRKNSGQFSHTGISGNALMEMLKQEKLTCQN